MGPRRGLGLLTCSTQTENHQKSELPNDDLDTILRCLRACQLVYKEEKSVAETVRDRFPW